MRTIKRLLALLAISVTVTIAMKALWPEVPTGVPTLFGVATTYLVAMAWRVEL